MTFKYIYKLVFRRLKIYIPIYLPHITIVSGTNSDTD